MMRMVSSWEPAAVSLTDYLNEDGEGVKKRRGDLCDILLVVDSAGGSPP